MRFDLNMKLLLFYRFLTSFLIYPYKRDRVNTTIINIRPFRFSVKEYFVGPHQLGNSKENHMRFRCVRTRIIQARVKGSQLQGFTVFKPGRFCRVLIVFLVH